MSNANYHILDTMVTLRIITILQAMEKNDPCGRPCENKNKNIHTEDSSPNQCLLCNTDLGECNPRQLCRKTYCESLHYFPISSKDNHPKKNFK